MILVGMGDNQIIEPPDPFPPEERGNKAVARIESFGLITATIDQDVLAVGKLQEGGRTLTDIKKADDEFSLFVREPEGAGKRSEEDKRKDQGE